MAIEEDDSAELLLASIKRSDQEAAQIEYLRERSIEAQKARIELDNAAFNRQTIPESESKHPAIVAERNHIEEPFGANRNDELAASNIAECRALLGMSSI